MQYKLHDNVLLRAEEPVISVELHNGTSWVPYPEDSGTPWTEAWFEGTPVQVREPAAQSSKAIDAQANPLFARAMTLKAVATRAVPRFRRKKMGPPLTGAEIKDGDGDGVIFDGSPEERPVMRRMPPQPMPNRTMPPAAGGAPGSTKKRPAPPDAPPKAQKPKTQPDPTKAKPSPAQLRREERGTQPAKKPMAKQGEQLPKRPSGMVHKVAPKPIDKVNLPDFTKASIIKMAATLTPQKCSEWAKEYESYSHETWAVVPLSREEAMDRSKVKNLRDIEKGKVKKAKEFDEKAALWAHLAENPDAAKQPFEYKPPEYLSLDELVPLQESSANVGSAGPQSWDDIDSYTQDRVMSDWIENRMTESDFLEWAGESIKESIEVEEVIRSNIDDLLENIAWDDLDAGQGDVADMLETTVKEAVNGGVKVGKEMSDDDVQNLSAALMQSSPEWGNGALSDEQIKQIHDLTIEAARQSEPGEVNLPSEDEIADITLIDEDEAATQIYDAWRRGKSWASSVDDLVDAELESQLENDDIIRPYAEQEWENMDYEDMFSAAASLGYAENDGYSDYDGERTNSTLSRYGIDDAASFVGAPDGSMVELTDNEITVTGEGGLQMVRSISRGSVSSDLFEIGEYYKGQGSDIFAQMVQQARNANFSDIQTHAAGSLVSDRYNGYYTWPLLGYDMELNDLRSTVSTAARAKFPGVNSIQDIYARPGGRDWWFVNGSGLGNAMFDLEEGSRSLAVLEGYLNERRQKS